MNLKEAEKFYESVKEAHPIYSDNNMDKLACDIFRKKMGHTLGYQSLEVGGLKGLDTYNGILDYLHGMLVLGLFVDEFGGKKLVHATIKEIEKRCK